MSRFRIELPPAATNEIAHVVVECVPVPLVEARGSVEWTTRSGSGVWWISEVVEGPADIVRSSCGWGVEAGVVGRAAWFGVDRGAMAP